MKKIENFEQVKASCEKSANGFQLKKRCAKMYRVVVTEKHFGTFFCAGFRGRR